MRVRLQELLRARRRYLRGRIQAPSAGRTRAWRGRETRSMLHRPWGWRGEEDQEAARAAELEEARNETVPAARLRERDELHGRPHHHLSRSLGTPLRSFPPDPGCTRLRALIPPHPHSSGARWCTPPPCPPHSSLRQAAGRHPIKSVVRVPGLRGGEATGHCERQCEACVFEDIYRERRGLALESPGLSPLQV